MAGCAYERLQGSDLLRLADEDRRARRLARGLPEELTEEEKAAAAAKAPKEPPKPSPQVSAFIKTPSPS